MASPAGSGPPHAPVPPGWPGDDPTLPEEVSVLGRPSGLRRAGHPGGVAGPPVGATRDLPRRADVPRRPDRTDVPGGDAGDDLDPDAGGDAGDDDLVAGVQPAGRVLVVMVLALVLAMLVNADALVDRAERKPAGPGRDRSLAIWHPVQDVSHALQLHRIRELADRMSVGDDGTSAGPLVTPRDRRRAPGATAPGGAGDAAGHGADAPDTAPGDGDTAGAPQPRAPTAAEPLRLWIGGDSMAEVFGRSLEAAAEATGVVDATLHYEMASGLTRPDYYDWSAALADDLAAGDPEVVVVVLGVNDGQGIVLGDGTPVPEVSDPRWAEEYRRRVGALMDQLRADDRWVVWVAQPPMREPGYAARLAVVNRVHAAEAAGRPWVTLIDTAAVLGGDDGGYTPTRPDAAGAPVEVRRTDGIHLTPAGADLLATHVFDEIRGRVDLSGAGEPGG
ncbi:MAG TPA: DUF459 domain-containing protein [Acidimicrobiales bacterium]